MVKASSGPFALPHALEGELARAYAFWDRLKRHEAEMAFWDDVKISTLPELAAVLAAAPAARSDTDDRLCAR